MSFLADFQKMKVDLSNYQPVCSPLITLNCLVEFNEIWYGSNAIQGDFDAIIFNPISSIILKVLRFKVVRGALLNCGFGLFTFHGNHGNQVVYCSKIGYIKSN
jgi:hypothetical protein